MHQVQCVSPYLAYMCLQFCVVHALTLLCCRCTYMSLLCFSCCFSLFGQHSAAAWILWQQWLVGTKDQGTQVSHMLYALVFCLLLCESGSEQIECVCVCVENCSVKFVVVTVQAFNTRTSISSLPVCCRQQAQLCTITDSRLKYVCSVHVSAFGMSDLWQHAATWMLKMDAYVGKKVKVTQF